MHPSPSLVDLEQAWAEHPLGRHRAAGGRRALDGFRYQLALSLERFFEVLERRKGDVETAFEGLSDLAQQDHETAYLVQVKTTLRRASLRHAIDEMLTIDAFLEESFPELRQQVRFAIWCRRLETTPEVAPLSASDLGLRGDDAERWKDLATRVDAVEVRADPFLALVVRYFDRLDNAFVTFEALLGRLLRLLSDGADSRRIGETLLDLWSHHQKAEQKPPGRLLEPRDFLPDGDDDFILVGDRPFLRDLRRGCFMPRRQRLEQVLEAIDGLLSGETDARHRRQLPVVWLEGAPGVGKSVLLLQVAEELINGRHLIVHHLLPSPESLAQALELWSQDNQRVVLAIDDVFAPNHRRHDAWQKIHQAIFDSRWHVLPLLLTCGPADYREAFERQVCREGTLRLETVLIDGLSDSERHDYDTWYRRRTAMPLDLGTSPESSSSCSSPPDSSSSRSSPPDSGSSDSSSPDNLSPNTTGAGRESNFATAAFLLHLAHRGQPPDVGQFAERLADRFRSQNLYDDMLVLLAAEVLGIQLPAEGFSSDMDFLDLLISEGILRRVDDPPSLHMMHPQLAGSLYEHLVPISRRHQRAVHITRCFEIVRSNGQAGEDLLLLLDPKANQRLDSRVRHQALENIGDILRQQSPAPFQAGHIRQWHLAAQHIDLTVAPKLLLSMLEWLRDSHLAASDWGQVWQVAWHLASGAKQELRARALVWLRDHPALPEWNYIWQTLWCHRHPMVTGDDSDAMNSDAMNSDAMNSDAMNSDATSDDEDNPLLPLAIDWLQQETTQAGWSYVFQALFAHGIRSASLRRAGLAGLRNTPISAADPHLWPKVWQLITEPWAFIDNFIHRLANCRIPYLQSEGMQFLWDLRRDHLGSEEGADRRLVSCFAKCSDQATWAYLLQNSHFLDLPSEHLRPIVIDWLRQYPERAEWNYLWQSLIDRLPDDAELLALGQEWLQDREDWPAWAFVWQKLLSLLGEDALLLDTGVAWLNGRQDRTAWSHVWQRLIEYRPQDAHLLRAGFQWLVDDQDRAEWNYIWRRLLGIYSPTDVTHQTLIELGTSRLESHPEGSQWPYIWQQLTLYSDDAELQRRGRAWLHQRARRPEWSFVWQRLLELQGNEVSLIELGQSWLKNHRSSSGWSFVWRHLIEIDATEDLLRQGRSWLRGRETDDGWSQVWRRLLDTSLEDASLLQEGRLWIRRYPQRGDWNFVWQALAIRFPWDKELFRLGHRWLKKRPTGQADQPASTFVRRRLQAMQPLQS